MDTSCTPWLSLDNACKLDAKYSTWMYEDTSFFFAGGWFLQKNHFIWWFYWLLQWTSIDQKAYVGNFKNTNYARYVSCSFTFSPYTCKQCTSRNPENLWHGEAGKSIFEQFKYVSTYLFRSCPNKKMITTVGCLHWRYGICTSVYLQQWICRSLHNRWLRALFFIRIQHTARYMSHQTHAVHC